MEYRWLLPGEQLQTELLPNHVLRLFRSDWDHDCLDVDVVRGIVTHRRQGSDQTGLPEHWDASTRPLRMQAGRWEVLISNEDLSRWSKLQSELVEKKSEFLRTHPQFDIDREIEHATSIRDQLARLQAGWNALAEDVVRKIDAWHAQQTNP